MWGRWGAAGLFLVAEGCVLLQHRASWTAMGGLWGIPGGARDSHEAVEQAALREAAEETGIPPERVRVVESLVTAGPFPPDPARPELAGNWSYTTVLARTDDGSRLATVANAESVALAWVPWRELDRYPLVPPLRAVLPELLKKMDLV